MAMPSSSIALTIAGTATPSMVKQNTGTRSPAVAEPMIFNPRTRVNTSSACVVSVRSCAAIAARPTPLR
jgi:hypothetical protein